MSATNPNRMASQWRRPRLALMTAAAALALGTAFGAPARAMVGHDYDPQQAPIATTWYRAADPAALRADRDYVTGMRAHHAGALAMSEAYLAGPEASSPVLRALAQAIIPNQRHEIGLLDEVARNLDRPPVVVNLGLFRLALQPAATDGLAQTQRFIKAPIPGPLAVLTGGGSPVTERDVQFAKAMTIHHQGALDMARAYNANPHARNGFLRLLNVDILADQSQEIALMRSVIAAYPGDPDAVPVPASMVHGMEGMGHGGDGAGHAGPGGHATIPPAAQPETTPRATPPAPQGREAPQAQQGHGGHMH